MLDILQAIFYDPLYNGLIFLIYLFPWMNIGFAAVFFTVLVKLALLPFSVKAVKTQQHIKKVQPEIDELKDKYSDDKQEQAMKMMELYNKNDIKPFSGFFLILIQLPIIFSLYYIFLQSGLPAVDPGLLYSFVPAPETIDVIFFGIDVTKKSLTLAVVAGLTQLVQSHTSFSTPGIDTDAEANTESADDDSFWGDFKQQFKKGLSVQLKYVFPIVVTFIAWQLSAVIALYWATSNIFHILQEVYVKKFALPRHMAQLDNLSSQSGEQSSETETPQEAPQTSS